MRIACGVHGYGQGHAMRASALLAELSRRHDVLVLAGGDAHAALAPAWRVERIPYLAYAYDGPSISWRRTFCANRGFVKDLLVGGALVGDVCRQLHEFAPDIVVSDSEPFSLRAAARIGIPAIVLDHVGVIAWCSPRRPFRDAPRLAIDGAAYRLLLGRPHRAIVPSFFEAPPRRPGVVRVSPILRERVLRAEPSDGDHLLVYFNQGVSLYTRDLDAALHALARPVRVFGAGRIGRAGNVTFHPFDDAAFVDALASCAAVLATGGHQVIGEAIHLRKPVLIAPEPCAEQRLNAREVERLGIGREIAHRAISARTLRAFLENLDPHRRALLRLPRGGGGPQAVSLLETFAAELAGERAAGGAPAPVAGRDVAAASL